MKSRRRVRVWFGQYQISDYIGAPAHAERYEAAMRRRFPGLEITNVALRSSGCEESADRAASDGSRTLFSV
ncbi:hypothetical protein ABZS29_01810 [Kribbella sp. NPDC005582]|uniref:hypothetical protein n=1 Tax=Kribbella sp. NPDC005582 TaxID=3156893 RepID=UPI0033AEDD97